MLLMNLGAQLGVSTSSCLPAAISEALDYDRVLSDPSTLAASFFLVNHIVIEAVEKPSEATSAGFAAHLKNPPPRLADTFRRPLNRDQQSQLL